jgi:hypothetical protein
LGDGVELYSGNTARIIELMPDPSAFRISPLAKRQLKQLAEQQDKSDAEILEIAIAHLLGTLDRDQPVWMTGTKPVPKGHKRPPDAA